MCTRLTPEEIRGDVPLDDHDTVDVDWNQYKEERRTKRANNKIVSTQMLENSGIKYESKNNGVHLIVESANGKIDFWPSTGKWICRTGDKGRGVTNLIKKIVRMTND